MSVTHVTGSIMNMATRRQASTSYMSPPFLGTLYMKWRVNIVKNVKRNVQKSIMYISVKKLSKYMFYEEH